MKNILTVALLALLFTSCEDFLQRDPQDFGSESSYFNTIQDLEDFNNGMYPLFPKFTINWPGLYTEDNNSDNQTSSSPNNLFYLGAKTIPDIATSQWKFNNIRDINYFLDVVPRKQQSGMLVADQPQINHYLGEALFFRAYEYYRLLVNYADVPILTKVLSNDFAEVAAASKRMPSNEVARFMLKDLQDAADMMFEKAPKKGRLSRDAALLMKARVALYEATFLKYQKGTAFVPGNSKWMGRIAHPDYQFPSGSIDDEINFFFEQAIAAADAVLIARPDLHAEYPEVFNRVTKIEEIKEVILANHYFAGVSTHSAISYLKGTGAGCGLTRSLIESYVMANGKPIYKAGPEYLGDSIIKKLVENRDYRLISSIKKTGYIEEVESDNPLEKEYKTFKPTIGASNQESPTGYELYKFVSEEPGQDKNSGSTTALPIFRTAEAMLIYLEAYYERWGNLGGNCDLYWRKIRKRAKIEEDYNVTINATDLSKERDLAVYSKGIPVDPTLYCIRRERRCEFIGEGMRLNDLKRWRALDKMQDYVIQGMNLWGPKAMAKFYKPSEELKSDIVSQASEGYYICPFRREGSTTREYNFPKAHYLEPIPVSEIIMTAPNGNVDLSPIYQNPAWSNKIAGPADYSVDLD